MRFFVLLRRALRRFGAAAAKAASPPTHFRARLETPDASMHLAVGGTITDEFVTEPAWVVMSAVRAWVMHVRDDGVLAPEPRACVPGVVLEGAYYRGRPARLVVLETLADAVVASLMPEF